MHFNTAPDAHEGLGTLNQGYRVNRRRPQKCGPLPRDLAGNTPKAQPKGTRVALAETALGFVIWGFGTGHMASPPTAWPEAVCMGAGPGGTIQKGFLCQVRGWATSEIFSFETAKILF